MATTVDEAFRILEGWLTPTATETQQAASHRASIDQCLRANFGMTHFFRSGSFGYGTSVSGFSDVDYFAVMPSTKLDSDSSVSLSRIAQSLRTRFPNTGVFVDSPAVVVPFGTTRSERHEIIPAHRVNDFAGRAVFGIPNRLTGWLASSPDAYGALIDNEHNRLKRVKQLIRFVKAWKYYNNVHIRSFYVEMRVWEYVRTQTLLVDRMDTAYALRHLFNSGLADMADPIGLSGTIFAGFQHETMAAYAAVRAAYQNASWALEEEKAGRTQSAFNLWNIVFNGHFPGYY
ncbi:MAG: nucleotidyltransferase [Gammaproteobacteria bacterium]|nr:nucleotidyltransferase [Gammaproteobacteria bacterium]